MVFLEKARKKTYVEKKAPFKCLIEELRLQKTGSHVPKWIRDLEIRVIRK